MTYQEESHTEIYRQFQREKYREERRNIYQIRYTTTRKQIKDKKVTKKHTKNIVENLFNWWWIQRDE